MISVGDIVEVRGFSEIHFLRKKKGIVTSINLLMSFPIFVKFPKEICDKEFPFVHSELEKITLE